MKKDITMGRQLKLIRNTAHISQGIAAKEIYNTLQGNLSNIENGRMFPSIEHVSAGYYSLGHYIDASDFLLDSWINSLQTKHPYNKVFPNAEELKNTILKYMKTFPNVQIKKEEIIKFYLQKSQYQLPSDSIRIPPFKSENREVYIYKNMPIDKVVESNKFYANVDAKINPAIKEYLKETIYNLNALLSLYQEQIDYSEQNENVSTLQDWIDEELRYADVEKLKLLKRFWDNIK